MFTMLWDAFLRILEFFHLRCFCRKKNRRPEDNAGTGLAVTGPLLPAATGGVPLENVGEGDLLLDGAGPSQPEGDEDTGDVVYIIGSRHGNIEIRDAGASREAMVARRDRWLRAADEGMVFPAGDG
jgi:hypothetical protein